MVSTGRQDQAGAAQARHVDVVFDRMEADQTASLKSKPQLVSRIGIRQCGSFSSTWKEKPYNVEAWNEQDDDLDVAPLGMPEDSDWTLYYLDPGSRKDRTLLYNAFMWTHRSRERDSFPFEAMLRCARY